ncbi:MAG: ATP-binding protein [Pseudomonadota bacterium]
MKARLHLATGAVLCLLFATVLFGAKAAHRSLHANEEMQTHIVPALRYLEQMRFGILRVVSSSSELIVAKLTQGAAAETDEAPTALGKAADTEADLIHEGDEEFRAALYALRALYEHDGGKVPDAFRIEAIDAARDRLVRQAEHIIGLASADAPVAEIAAAKERFEALEMQALAMINLALSQAQEAANRDFEQTTQDITDLRNEIVLLGLLGIVVMGAYSVFLIRLLQREADARLQAERLALDNAREVERRKRIEGRLAAHQKMEALGTMLGGIAHSVNNFLMPVITLSKMLKQDAPEGSEQREDLARIQASGEKASRLLKEVLAFSRTTETAASGHCELVGALRRTLSIATATLPATLALRPHIGLDAAWVPESEADIDTMLFNLLGNAVDAMQGRSGEIRVHLDRVRVEDGLADGVPVRLEAGDYARLGIADEGCGIPEDVLDHIFEPFFTTKAVGKGTGLGLSVTYGSVSQAGGDIVVTSQPGVGTRFDIFLPLLPAPDERAAPPAA